MKITQIAEGAFFVPSYSEQCVTPSYDTSTSLPLLGVTEPQAGVKPAQLKEEEPVTIIVA